MQKKRIDPRNDNRNSSNNLKCKYTITAHHIINIATISCLYRQHDLLGCFFTKERRCFPTLCNLLCTCFNRNSTSLLEMMKFQRFPKKITFAQLKFCLLDVDYEENQVTNFRLLVCNISSKDRYCGLKKREKLIISGTFWTKRSRPRQR